MNNSLYQIASRSEAIHDLALTMLGREQLGIGIVDQARLRQLSLDLENISDTLEEIAGEEGEE